MTCDEIRDRIAVTTTLGRPLEPDVREHLEACGACRDEVGAIRQAAAVLAAAHRLEESRARRAPLFEERENRPLGRRLPVLGALAAAAVVLVAAWLGWRPLEPSAPVTPRETATVTWSGHGLCERVGPRHLRLIHGEVEILANGAFLVETPVARLSGDEPTRFTAQIRNEEAMTTIQKRSTLGAGAVAILLIVGVQAGWVDVWPEDPAESQRRVSSGEEATISRTPAEPGVAEETEPAAEPKGPQLVVAVRDESGGAAADVGVILAVAGRVVTRGQTDAAGEVSLDAPGGDGEIVLLPGFAPPVRRPHSLAAGRAEITLSLGSVIAGRVLVGDEPPAEPLELTAWSRVPFPGFEAAVQPFAGETGTWKLRTRTDRTGAFAFRGLSADWRAYLSLPREYRFVDPAGNATHQSLSIEAPNENMLIRIRRLPVVTGRVVDADGKPSPGAQVRLETHSEGGNTTYGPRADLNGRFRIQVSRLGIIRASFTWSDAGKISSDRRELDPGLLRADLDLGDLKLPPLRVIELQVTDEAGAAVSGAWATTAGERRPLAGPSDDLGHLTIPVAETDETLRVGALGRSSVTVRIRPGVDSTSVVLPEGNVLRVLVEEPGGGPASGVRVVASAAAPMFVGRTEGPDPLMRASGGSGVYSWSHPEGEGRDVGMFGQKNGETVLAGITAGNPVRIEVRDAVTGTVLASREIALAARGTEEMVIRLKRAIRPVTGLVVDPDGKPIVRAQVLATVPGGGHARATTDEDGRFALIGLRDGRIDLTVGRYGFASREFKGLDIPSVGRSLDLELRPGRTVRVTIVDSAGAPVADLEPDDVGAIAPGLSESVGGFGEGGGTYVVKTLPPGTVTLFASVGGRRITKSHDTSEPKARIVVPRTGSVAVHVRFPFDSSTIHHIRLVSVAGDGLEVAGETLVDRLAERTMLVPRVLPGRYRVLLEVYARRKPEGYGYIYDLVQEGPQVTVRAGVRSEVEMVR
jgi:Carboxypeptidase regulatory-like domain